MRRDDWVDTTLRDHDARSDGQRQAWLRDARRLVRFGDPRNIGTCDLANPVWHRSTAPEERPAPRSSGSDVWLLPLSGVSNYSFHPHHLVSFHLQHPRNWVRRQPLLHHQHRLSVAAAS